MPQFTLHLALNHSALIIAAFLLSLSPGFSQPPENSDPKEKQAAERFLDVLLKRPRTGTALDKVYAFHLENGTLEQLCERLETKARNTKDGHTWTTLGLLESIRGNEDRAIQCLQQGEAIVTTDPLASYYLANALMGRGEITEAIQAYQRALARNPNRADALLIAREFASVYQRSSRSAEGIEVLTQIEAKYPDDLILYEQTAEILVEGGEFDAALNRYLRLIKLTKDPAKRVELGLKSAVLESKLGQGDTALQHMESLRTQVNPESWIARELQSKLEESFLSKGDSQGLIAYYQTWLKTHSEDLEAAHRLAKLLISEYRPDDALDVYRSILLRAPKDRESLAGKVDIYADQKKTDEAIQAMRDVLALDPKNPDSIVRLGSMIASRPGTDPMENAREAIDIWNKLIEQKPNDPMTLVKVAELSGKTPMVAHAIELYRRSISLAPDDPQYREFLGQSLLKADRRQEALEAWRSIAEEDRRTPENLVRLSEILAMHGEPGEAITMLTLACEKKPRLADRLSLAQMLSDANRLDESKQQLLLAKTLVEEDAEEDLFYKKQLEILQVHGQVESHLAQWKNELENSGTANQWRAFARMAMVARQLGAADEAVRKAIDLEPNSIRVHLTAAEIWKSMGQWDNAIGAHERLVQLDRRAAVGHYREISKLNRMIGRFDLAIAAANKVIEYANADAESFLTVAEIYLEREQTALGFSALQRAIRVKPRHFETLVAAAKLFETYADPDRAIELYWRALEVSDDLSKCNDTIKSMAQLYEGAGRFPVFLERLARTGLEKKQVRKYRLLETVAYLEAGEEQKAERSLTSLLAEKSDDIEVMELLIPIYSEQKEFSKAIECQSRIIELAPSLQRWRQQVKLHVASNDLEATQELSFRLLAKNDENLYSVIVEIWQTALSQQNWKMASAIAEAYLEKRPGDWEVYSDAMSSYFMVGKKQDALQLAKRVSAMRLPIQQPTKFSSRTATNLTPADVVDNAEEFRDFLNQRPYSSLQLRESFGGVLCQATEIELQMCTSAAEAEAVWKKHQPMNVQNSDDAWRLYLIANVFYMHTNESRFEKICDDTLQTLVQLGECDAVLSQWSDLAEATRAEIPSESAILKMDQALRGSKTTSSSYVQKSLLACKVDLASAFHRLEKKELRDEWIAKALTAATQPGAMIGRDGALMKIAIQQLRFRDEASAKETFHRGLQSMQSSTSNVQVSELYNCLRTIWDSHGEKETLAALYAVLKRQAELSKALSPARLDQMSKDTVLNSSCRISGAKDLTLSIEYPAPSGLLQSEFLMCVKIAHHLLATDEAAKERFHQTLSAWAEASNLDSVDQSVFRLAYHSVLYWDRQFEPALSQLDKILLTHINEKWITRLKIRALHNAGKIEEALAILNKTPIGFYGALADRELHRMQLCIQANDRAGIRESANKLLAQRLSSSTVKRLLDVLRQAGMFDLVQTLESREKQRKRERIDDLAQRMEELARNGDVIRAGNLANLVLHRTTNTGYYSDEIRARLQAIEVLRKTNQLERAIELAETRLSQSPRSVKLLSELNELVVASGDQSKSDSLRGRIVESSASENVESVDRMIWKLVYEGNGSDAISLALNSIALYAKSPDYLSQLVEAGDHELADRVVQKIGDIGIQNCSHPEEVSSIVFRHFCRTKQNLRINEVLLFQLKTRGIAGLCEHLSNRNGLSFFEPSPELVRELLSEIRLSSQGRNDAAKTPNSMFGYFDRGKLAFDPYSDPELYLHALTPVLSDKEDLNETVLAELRSLVRNTARPHFETALLILCLANRGSEQEITTLLDGLLGAPDFPDKIALISALQHGYPLLSNRDRAVHTRLLETILPSQMASSTKSNVTTMIQENPWLLDLPIFREKLAEVIERTKVETLNSGYEYSTTHFLTTAKEFESAVALLFESTKGELSTLSRERSSHLENEWNYLLAVTPIELQLKLLEKLLRAPQGSDEETVYRMLLGESSSQIDSPQQLCRKNPFLAADENNAVPLVNRILKHKEVKEEVHRLLTNAIPSESLSLTASVVGSYAASRFGEKDLLNKWLAILKEKLEAPNDLANHRNVMYVSLLLGGDLLNSSDQQELGRSILEKVGAIYRKQGSLIAWVGCELLVIDDLIKQGRTNDALERLDQLFQLDLSQGTLLSRGISSEGNASFYVALFRLSIAEWAAERGLANPSLKYATETLSDGFPLPDLEEKERSRGYRTRRKTDSDMIRDEIGGKLKRMDGHWIAKGLEPSDALQFWLNLVAPPDQEQALNCLATGYDPQEPKGPRYLPTGLKALAAWAKLASRSETLRSRIATRKSSPVKDIIQAAIEYEISEDDSQRSQRFNILLEQIEAGHEMRLDVSEHWPKWLHSYLAHECKKHPQLVSVLIQQAIDEKHWKNNRSLLPDVVLAQQFLGSPTEMLRVWKRLSIETIIEVSQHYAAFRANPKRMEVIAETIPMLKYSKSRQTPDEVPISEPLIETLMNMDAEKCFQLAGSICQAHPELSVKMAIEKPNWAIATFRLERLRTTKPVAQLLLHKNIRVITVWDVWFAAAESLQRTAEVAERIDAMQLDAKCKAWVLFLRARFDNRPFDFEQLLSLRSGEGDAERKAGLPRWVDDQKRHHLIDVELIREALRDSRVRELALAELNSESRLPSRYDNRCLEELRNSLEAKNAATHWIEVPDARSFGLVQKPSWSQANQTLRYIGTGRAAIMYRFPIGGDFEMSGRSIGSSALKAGYSFDNNAYGSRSMEFLRHEQFSRWGIGLKDQNIQIGSFSSFRSDALRPNDSFPFAWFAVSKEAIGVKITRTIGRPKVCSEVPLIAPNLPGWIALGQSPAISADEFPMVEPFPGQRDPDKQIGWRIRPAVYDQTHPDNVAELVHVNQVSREANESEGEVVLTDSKCSILRYQRPMQPGDLIDYEYYVDDQTNVSLMIGSQVYRITPDGIQAKPILTLPPVWLQSSLDWAAEPDGQSLAPASNINNGWHRATVTMGKTSFDLSIDGTPIYRGQVVDPPSALFGLYHDSTKSQVRIRNMKLTGDWPKELPENWME